MWCVGGKELCMYLARGGVGGELIRGLDLGLTNPVKTGGSVGRVCVWVAVVYLGSE